MDQGKDSQEEATLWGWDVMERIFTLDWQLDKIYHP